jgi:SET domain-containing protein
MAIGHTMERGWGLYAKEEIQKGDFVIEYVGELISTKEYK